MAVKTVHTTIPEQYHLYVSKKGLHFSDLLKKAIENEMSQEPNVIQGEIQKIERKKKELQNKLKKAKKQEEDKKKRVEAMQKGLIQP